jgi:hypothetical protein
LQFKFLKNKANSTGIIVQRQISLDLARCTV